MNWARGFFRAWLVASTLWVALFGWNAFTNNTWSGWRSYPVADDCMDRCAKWPDGKPWDEWDRAGFIAYNPTLPESENNFIGNSISWSLATGSVDLIRR
jgi:hypothetical protein